MQTFKESGFRSDLSPKGRGVLPWDEQRAYLHDHPSMRRVPGAGFVPLSIDTSMEKYPLSRSRSRAIRARLLERARTERGIVRSRGGGGGLWASAGWLVAAGLATLLFTHHSFHRPLALGWGLSGVLALTCFGLVLYVTYLRSQLNRMRAGGLPDGSDYADFATGGPKSATRPQD